MAVHDEAVVRAPWRRWIRRRSSRESHLARALIGQVRAVREGAVLAKAMTSREISPGEARTMMATVEHRGDEMRAELVERLARTLATPLDREDLFRLSRSIDDVLDTIRDFVREADLYQIEKRNGCQSLLTKVIAAIDVLDEAVQAIWQRPDLVTVKALEAKKAARVVNREYQEEFAKIVRRTTTPEALKRRELVKRLDWVGVRISDAADDLTDGALKRGY